MICNNVYNYYFWNWCHKLNVISFWIHPLSNLEIYIINISIH
jgi:hypothetical protein